MDSRWVSTAGQSMQGRGLMGTGWGGQTPGLPGLGQHPSPGRVPMLPWSSVSGLGDPAPRSVLGDAPSPATLARAPGQGGGCPQPPESVLGRGEAARSRGGKWAGLLGPKHHACPPSPGSWRPVWGWREDTGVGGPPLKSGASPHRVARTFVCARALTGPCTYTHSLLKCSPVEGGSKPDLGSSTYRCVTLST